MAAGLTQGWRRYCYPRAVFKGATLMRLTTRGDWLLERSRERFARRLDADRLVRLLDAELGFVETFRFILD